MRLEFSGTFLNSTIAKRIALILFLAALIPTLLITSLANKTIDSLTIQQSHKNLVETSKNSGLNTFSRLIFARNSLQQFSNILSQQTADAIVLEKIQLAMFDGLLLIDDQGKILEKFDERQPSNASIHTILKQTPLHPKNSQLLIISSTDVTTSSQVLMIIPHQEVGEKKRYLVGEINQRYLWGDGTDYASNMEVCAFQKTAQLSIPLFCSNTNAISNRNTISTLENASWSLFLRAEFEAEDWQFITTRLTTNPLVSDDFMNNQSFIGVALLSLLSVALIGLIHIRKTMVPLERLVSATRNITQGIFTQVKVQGAAEFTELANSFNSMSSNIQRQLNTMQSLSTIDRQLAAKLNVDELIKNVIHRIQLLIPSASILVIQIQSRQEDSSQCQINTSEKIVLRSTHMVITNDEIAHIAFNEQGFFFNCKQQPQFKHAQLLCQLGAHHSWTLPIVWQGQLFALLTIGHEQTFDQNNPDWEEIRELATRIGIAISAKAREDQLLTQAQYDSLTGLPNRILLQDRIHQAMEHSDHSGQPFWLAFIDLDRFKFINDSLGHKAGDALLAEMAKRLKFVIEDTDTVARFGGDEFIVILQGELNENARMAVLYRLIQISAEPMLIEGKQLFVTASIGVSAYPNDASDIDTLLRNADIAMYRAKEMGKNNFQFFTESMNKRATDRLLMETHLRQALALNEFQLVYQAKVNLQTNKIVGMEALIRWHSKALGYVSPQQFIMLAEETGLIVPIGEWALKTACAQTFAWHQMGFQDLLISVNLSASQFKQKDLVESIASILKETQLPARNLELELTESMVMDGVNTSIKILNAIKSTGVHLSVDDFGTGYSSLSYLKNLPIDTLKIDKSFTDDIVHHNDDVPIVASIILLAKNLKLKVVAEGVENEEQVLYLSKHGCDEMQGYYFSQPKRAEEFQVMLFEKNES